MPPPTPASLARTHVTLKGQGLSLSFEAAVPAGPTSAGSLLPLARALSDAINGETCRSLEAAGINISCAEGCGACCRSLVAISEVEARRLRQVVDALDDERRSEVQARFARARQRLQQAGHLEALQDTTRWSEADYGAMLGTYFALGIACPFLQAESCSIYPERPLACREFMVTSPPAHCAELASAHVKPVQLPMRVSQALARWQPPPQATFPGRWVPLVLAPEWADAHPDDRAARPGLELLRELLEGVRGQD